MRQTLDTLLEVSVEVEENESKKKALLSLAVNSTKGQNKTREDTPPHNMEEKLKDVAPPLKANATDVTGHRGEVASFVSRLVVPLRAARARVAKFLAVVADSKTLSETIMAELDTNLDGSVDKEEVSVALGPLVAPAYPLLSSKQAATAVMFPGVLDADSSGSLEECEFERAAWVIRSFVVAYIGDVNGDGYADVRDAAVLARRFMTDARARDDTEPESGGATSQPASGATAAARAASMLNIPRARKASLLGLATHRYLTGSANPSATLSSAGAEHMPGLTKSLTAQLDRVIQTLPVSRIRCCIYLSAVMASFFACSIVLSAFRGYNRLFDQMATGKHTYRGHTQELRDQYSTATYFLGILMSTVVMGWLLCYWLLLPIFSVLMFADIYVALWEYRTFLLVLIISKLVLVVLRSVVCDMWMTKDGEISKPVGFACVWVVLVVFSFALGILASVFRLILIAPVMIYRYNTLDDTMVSESFCSMDTGYFSLLTLTYTTYEKMNPIRQAFISALCGSAHRQFGPTYLTEHEVTGKGGNGEATAEMITAAARRKILRNRWWLYVHLERHKPLRDMRRWTLPPEIADEKGGQAAAQAAAQAASGAPAGARGD